MFLSKVFRHSKWLFALLLIFIAGQLLVGYKRGMVVTPFYNYGMYSEVIKVKPAYEVWEIKANDKLLRGQDFSPQQWDRILLPVQYFAAIKSNNNFSKLQVERLLGQLHVSIEDNDFLQACNYSAFEDWYKKYLGGITHETIATIDIQRRGYSFQSGKLIPSNNTMLLAEFCH